MNGSRAQIATVYPNCDTAHVYAVFMYANRSQGIEK